MAATLYYVMCRYFNNDTNMTLTNDQKNQYDELCEFYCDPGHRMYSGEDLADVEELAKQQEFIANAGMVTNPKYNMLFRYTGTKKISHPHYVLGEIGYVINHWEEIPRGLIGNRGDFSKRFTTLDYDRPEEGGVVVCTGDVLKKYYNDGLQMLWQPPSNRYIQVTYNDILQRLEDHLFKLNDYEPGHYVNTRKITTYHYEGPTDNRQVVNDSEYYLGSQDNSIFGAVYIDYPMTGNVIDVNNGTLPEYDSKGKGYSLNNVNMTLQFQVPVASGTNNNPVNKYKGYVVSLATGSEDAQLDWLDHPRMGVSISIKKANIETTTIPGHYVESSDNPYMVKDCYERIESSPWVINSTCSSLEGALEKAKKLIVMLGIENVKVIKNVAIDQFIKVR